MKARRTPYGLAAVLTHPGLLIAGATLLTVMAVCAVVLQPLFALAPFGLCCAVLFLVFPTVRLVTVVFGAFLVFQSSDSVSLSKVVYLIAVAAAIGISLVTMHQLKGKLPYRLLLPLVFASIVSYAGLAASFVISSSNGIELSSWLRDAATYALLASVPIIAMDAQRIRPITLERILVILGLVSAVSVGIGWAAKRGYLELPVDRLLLASASPAYALVFYSFIRLLADERPKPKWLAYIGFVTAMLVMSGSRSAFFAFLALVPIFFLSRGEIEKKLNRVVASATIGVIVLVLMIVGIVQTALVDFSGVLERFERIPDFISSPSGDPSFNERTIQTNLAWATFQDHFALGTGPGYVFEVFRPTANRFTESIVMDTSLVFLVKFGVVGLVWGSVLGLLFARLAIAAARRAAGEDLSLYIVAWASYTVVYLPFVSVFDDKGYSLALGILLAIGLRKMSHGRTEEISRLENRDGRRRSISARISSDTILQPRRMAGR